jgi:hypothetical protein
LGIKATEEILEHGGHFPELALGIREKGGVHPLTP